MCVCVCVCVPYSSCIYVFLLYHLIYILGAVLCAFGAKSGIGMAKTSSNFNGFVSAFNSD